MGREKSLFFRASAEDFKNIPGSPVVYWVSKSTSKAFSDYPPLNSVGHACSGVQTGNNDIYLRQWFEVLYNSIGFNMSNIKESEKMHERWLPHKKGGQFRRWYGNCDYIIDWQNSGFSIKNNISARPQNVDYWFTEAVTWSHTSSSLFSARFTEEGYSFNVEGPSYFSVNPLLALGFLCSAPALHFMKLLNPTLHFLVGSVSVLPWLEPKKHLVLINKLVSRLIEIAKYDWNSSETTWDFSTLPILQSDYYLITLSDTYANLRTHWLENTLEMQRLEEENNCIFIDAYGLQDELTPEVPLSEITLSCNPHYRYKGKKTEAELEALLLADTMKEFISYAVGCMFGRYSLDKPGLILANQGETIEDYLAQISSPTFSADDNNVIPILDGDWFSDDITERFFMFLHVTFGDEYYEENLQFIENAIGKTIRKYFLKDFYNDHVRRYKKRPIYWMFSSPKGSFNVLIYMHRYQPDTVSIILNGYLREFRAKLNAKLAHLEKVGIGSDSSKSEKAKAIKEIEKLKKIITEVESYERDVLYPLATEQVEIDLDDGVKVNYNKFGTAMKKITGLTEKGK